MRVAARRKFCLVIFLSALQGIGSGGVKGGTSYLDAVALPHNKSGPAPSSSLSQQNFTPQTAFVMYNPPRKGC